MNKLSQRTNRLFIFISIFFFVTMLGFVPWDPLLSIQIRNSVLIFLTSIAGGLIGLFGLILTILIYLKPNKSVPILKILLTGFLIPIAFFFIIVLLLPNFKWQDTSVYRNGDDYLVAQTFEGFVTNSIVNPRIIRTTSPYGIIRKVEEQFDLTITDDRFDGDDVIYQGKTWHKENIKNE